MVQIKCFINGLYSLNNSNIPFGMGFQPLPPLKEEFRLNITFLRLRFPLNFVIYRRSLIKMFGYNWPETPVTRAARSLLQILTPHRTLARIT